MRLLIAVAMVAVLAACGGDGPDVVEIMPTPISSDVYAVMTMVVGPERVECTRYLAPKQKCLVVNGETFMDRITGFSHQEGITWTIKVRRVDPWGEYGVPQTEMPYYYYFLLEVVDRDPPREDGYKLKPEDTFKDR